MWVVHSKYTALLHYSIKLLGNSSSKCEVSERAVRPEGRIMMMMMMMKMKLSPGPFLLT